MITTLKGDMTRLDFDIIVNPSNEKISPIPGVNDSLFKEAGQDLIFDAKDLHGCQLGQAKMTLAYRLPCSVIIHTAFPKYMDGEQDELVYLEACYWNTMCLAYDFKIKNKKDKVTLAFPNLSKYFRFPEEVVVSTAVKTIKRLFETYPDTKDVQVTFVCDNEKSYLLYKKELRLR